MPDVHVVVLAAGRGTRMKSVYPKVLHRVGGAPMIARVLTQASRLSPRSTTIVVGYGADQVKSALAERPGLTFVLQEPQLGTAHALLCASAALGGATGTVVLLSGDVPLLSAATLAALVDRHLAARAAATIVTAVMQDPTGYGRIVRTTEGGIGRIVEERDASPAERDIREINGGVYAFDLDGLFDALKAIATNNAQNEYYLPDLVAVLRARGRVVETITVPRVEEILGINSRVELAAVSRLVRLAKTEELMAAGVTIEDPATTYIDPDVMVGPDTIIHPGVALEGKTTVGSACEIHGSVRIVDCSLGDRVVVLSNSVLTGARVEDAAQVGPFAHLRKDSAVGPGAKVGNFVEMKKTSLGQGSKSMHLSYLGDAVIGSNVNIGAGTITCNYDGVSKRTTTIEDGAFIGSDTQLIAPVTVGKGAYVGSGTTVREDVPPGALAVSAGRQRNVEGWVEEKKKRKKRENN